MTTSILDESQEDRDFELAQLIKIPRSKVNTFGICSPESIRIFDQSREISKPDDFIALYQNYPYLELGAYLRTLMFTSVKRRHPNLFELLKNTSNKECLDFGSGVGSHAIALMENHNQVTLLDVQGPLRDLAVKRITHRSLLKYCRKILDHNGQLPQNTYDVIICTDVLEHVYDPMRDIDRIRGALKKNGLLHLEVSKMIKPSSGHFASSINKWELEGPDYLDRYFRFIKKTIYQKK